MNRRDETKARCLGLKFDITCTDDVSLDKMGNMTPHICCYTDKNFATVRASDPSSRLALGYAELFVDIAASDPSRDFFSDPPPDADSETRSYHSLLSRSHNREEQTLVEESFGQHISYVIEIFARQPRVFLYTVYMVGSRARLLRWDRSGFVVSESFDIRERPEVLCEFLWRFSLTAIGGQGHDMSISVASPGEEAIFCEVVKKHVLSQLGPGEDVDKAMAQHYEPGRVFAAAVLPQGFTTVEENICRILFSRPVITPLYLTGRATWGCWAVDVATERIVFLKDTWQYFEDREPEGVILRRFSDIGVSHVPSVVWHGYVAEWFPKKARKLTRESPNYLR